MGLEKTASGTAHAGTTGGAGDFFENIPSRIPFEGPASRSVLAYKYYNVRGRVSEGVSWVQGPLLCIIMVTSRTPMAHNDTTGTHTWIGGRGAWRRVAVA
jgi:hypothetical protein